MVLLFFNCGVVDEMKVNVSGKLDINILNNKHRVSKNLPFYLVFLYYTSDLLLAIDDLVAHINSGATRKSFISKIDSIVQVRKNNFIYNKSYNTELKSGLILSIALKKFIELIYDRKDFLKLVCYFLDKEICKFPLTMGEFNSYRRTHPTHLSDSTLYYKFNALGNIFNHLNVFVHLLVAGNPALIAKQIEIRNSILQKNYREFYNFFASELNMPIEEVFFWCCDYEAKNKNKSSNPTPPPQSTTSQQTPTPQTNSNQQTPNTQTNSSQSTPNTPSDPVNIQDVLNMYESSDLTPAEKLFQFCTSFDSETEVVKNDNSKNQDTTNNQNDSNSVVNEDLSINSSVDNTNSQNKLKYKITTNKYNLKTDIFATTTLYQIEALIDIDCYNVKAGDLGGFIESESNLSHSGKCWVNDSACVYGNAIIQDNAQVYDNAHVYGNAKVAGNAQVYNNADVSDNVKIFNNVQICGNADLRHDVCVSDNVQVYDNACVCNKVVLEDNVWIGGSAHISNNSNISGNAWITGNARISGAKISDNVRVYGSTWILGNIELSGNVRVFDRAHIGYKELKSLIKLGGNTQVCGRTRLTS